MKLSRNTWHYKLYRYLRNFVEDGPILPFRGTRVDYAPRSLCSYFWTTTALVAFLPLYTIGLAAIGVLILLLAPIWWPLMRRSEKKEEAYEAAIAAYHNGQGPHPDIKFVKRESLIKAWIKAYKAKHCPLVTLVD